ncbi:BTAD domain-containing putative transcriptional regulator [Actinomadura litoris]|uniref:AAA family ATPase n=1 Tax=Actinomadura litoris TaxID=2678616 RepID=A0A7K1L405_9ACTN|nr:BTAD domain-containing putative transcriptional regulator [Actinomadura litoris]MUN39043.1 AAA family ATPase [Actinomadura litoris]
MRFSLLGPLEARRDDRPVPLGGVNQRAALGFLLLHANTVVSTSDLIRALWDDPVPPTARKMVQNAIAAVRRALPADGQVALRTAPPGYLLRVDPGDIDVTRFHALVDRGRADFRAQQWEPAARRLREALALWRGPAMADVTETGTVWPELTMLEETRLAALEDCLEAELALGRHHALIGEMTSLAEEEPARERLCGLLMLALYRCGRQPEALAAYQRLRDILRDGFGLDPAPELRDLERDILNQHPGLAPPLRTARDAAVTIEGAVAAEGAEAAAPAPERAPAPAGTRRSVSERKRASVLQVRTRVDVGYGDSECVDEALNELARVINEEARRYGGLVRETLGSVRPVVFGFPRSHEDDPERAIHAALAIRERITRRVSAFLGVQIAIATGEVLATYRDEGDTVPAQLSGTVPHAAEQLLAHTPPGTIRVCRATARAAGLPPLPEGDDVAAAGRELTLPPPAPAPPSAGTGAPLLGRDRDLAILRGLLGDVERRQRPHMATILGEPGIGKSRLIAEFVAGLPGPVLVGRTPPYAGEPLAPLADTLRSLPDGADPALRIERAPAEAGGAEWRRHITGLALDTPVTIVLEDLHRADGALLDQVEDLTERLPPVPLLIVVTARPELRQSRPRWGCGKRDVTTLTLDTLSPEDAGALLPRASDPQVLGLVGGNPRHAEEYARAVRACTGGANDGAPPVPARLRALLTARIDTLSLPERAVLRDATFFQGRVRVEGVAALSGRTTEETAEILYALERKDFLVRWRPITTPLVPSGCFWGEDPPRAPERASDREYSFRQPLLREIAHAQLPRSQRIAGHRRAIAWIATLPPGEVDLLVHHYRQLVVLNSPQLANDVARQARHALLDAERRATAAGAHDTAARCRRAARDLRPAPPPRPAPARAASRRVRRVGDPPVASYN